MALDLSGSRTFSDVGELVAHYQANPLQGSRPLRRNDANERETAGALVVVVVVVVAVVVVVVVVVKIVVVFKAMLLTFLLEGLLLITCV